MIPYLTKKFPNQAAVSGQQQAPAAPAQTE
jgi:hypothetical protein